ncbi:MAG TPA: hypothetical protein VH643_04000 [Gemmataceae bacterium]|jgi:anti-sigma-K factor RskA
MLEIGPADAHLAFLYVSGEMDAPEAAEFERRLGDEQLLRESLCRAVELLQTLEGLAPPVPRLHYRERVRRRLGICGKWWQRLTRTRAYRGHPALWCGLGAAAALLAVSILSRTLFATDQKPQTLTQAPAAPVAKQTSPIPPAAPLEETDEDMLDIAEQWASMDNGDHLARAHEEELRRRDRRLLHTDHALHLPGSSSFKH